MTASPAIDSFLEELLLELQRRMRKEQYDTWFRGFRLTDLAEDEVVFSVPSVFVRDWLTKNYFALLQDAVLAVGGRPRRVRISTDVRQEAAATAAADTAAAVGSSQQLRAGASNSNGTATAMVVTDVIGDVATSAPAPAPTLPPGPAPTFGSGTPSAAAGWRNAHPRSQGQGDCKLNPHLTFEQFVVGPCNRLSHAAAMAIGENPGKAYNPLFIHGNVGLGKTHLLQAICHAILRRQAHTRVVYLSCEEFTNRFIHSIQHGTIDEFRGYHRNADVLVVDDVQFLTDKNKTQDEFFHTFNALYNQQKQIVISSDRAPLEINTVEDRLISRFKWGLVTEMELPCFETRVAIVKRKARIRGTDLPDEVAYYIAERIDTNIRELEGAMVKVFGMAAIVDRPITIELAEEALRGVAVSRPNRVSLGDVMAMITNEFSISARDLTGKCRTQAVSLPRQIGMFLAREHTEHSLEEIGLFFGNRDHTTVLYGVGKIKAKIEKDRMFRELVSSLSSRLSSGRYGRNAD